MLVTPLETIVAAFPISLHAINPSLRASRSQSRCSLGQCAQHHALCPSQTKSLDDLQTNRATTTYSIRSMTKSGCQVCDQSSD
ncbi:MAG: hypothetical protein CSA75_04620, partial [Sorangium cellulosum]